jgi:hypothetical protein
MKNLIPPVCLLTAIGTFSFPSATLAAETNDPAPQMMAPQPAVTAEAQPAAASAPARLPYGVEDVLKLSRAQVSEDIIVNYIQNSGTIYNLGVQDIVYLRNEGVSDRVVNSMLDQRQKLTQVAAQTAPQPSAPTAAPAPAAPEASVAAAAPDSTQYAQQAPTYVQAPEAQPAPSTVYVIPYPDRTYAYYGTYAPYGYYRYYGPGYYGYYGPTIGLGFRFGGGHGHFHGSSGHHR